MKVVIFGEAIIVGSLAPNSLTFFLTPQRNIFVGGAHPYVLDK